MLTHIQIPGVPMIKEHLNATGLRAQDIMEHTPEQVLWDHGQRYVIDKWLQQGDVLAVTWIYPHKEPTKLQLLIGRLFNR